MSDDRRYYGLDALRGGMMLLGLVIHAATVYIAAPPPHVPMVTDRNTSLVMDAILDFIHSFRMPMFFVLSGFFTALLVEKRGLAGTYRNRAARVLAPLVAGLFTILPVTMLFFADFALRVRLGSDHLIPTRDELEFLSLDGRAHGVPAGLPVLHLWFLLYLCYFYLLLIPFSRMLVRWSLRAEASVGRVLGSPLALVLFALLTAVTLWAYPGGLVFGDFIMLGFSPAAFAYYGVFFVIGYVYHHYRGATARLVEYMPWCAALAAVLFPLSVWASHLEYTHPAAEAGFHVLAVGVHGLCTWSLIWLFTGLALRYADRPTTWALYASQSAYWVYLLHLPVTVFMAWMLAAIDAPAIAKFAAVMGVTSVVCFLTYHYWVQDSRVSVFLNGKRFKLDWPWRRALTQGAVNAGS